MDQAKRNEGDADQKYSATGAGSTIPALVTEPDSDADLADQINDTLDVLDDQLVDLQAKIERLEARVVEQEQLVRRIERLESKVERRTNAQVMDGEGDARPDVGSLAGGPK